MTFGIIGFQVAETETFKLFFSNYFKAIHLVQVQTRKEWYHQQSLQGLNYRPQKTNHKDLC